MADFAAVEARSYDFVPEEERHGSVRSQFQLWFMVNATLITLYTGAVGPSMGLSLGWSLIAILLGTLAGTMFQAFHGAQGPHMGLPQMIQSRVQFGSAGVLIPIIAATIAPFGFALFFVQTGSYAIMDVTGSDQATFFQFLLTLLAALIAIVGYRLVMKVEGIAAYATLINFGLLSIAAITLLPWETMWAAGGFVAVPFLAQFGASAIYQLAIAPIVSDYTRYLPTKTPGAAVSASVFFGTVTSALWFEALGAALATAFPEADVVSSLRQLGDDFGFHLGAITMVLAAITCLITASITAYSGTIAFLSGLEAFRRVPPTAALRAWSIAIAMGLVLIASLSMSEDTLGAFGAFLSILGYVLIPWTAVNLTDYYFVRKGKYSISDIVKPDGGIYGRWGRIGIISYAVGFAAMIPFFSCALYTGPVAAALGGADISFVVGLLVASVLYYVMAQKIDLKAELELVKQAPLNTLG